MLAVAVPYLVSVLDLVDPLAEPAAVKEVPPGTSVLVLIVLSGALSVGSITSGIFISTVSTCYSISAAAISSCNNAFNDFVLISIVFSGNFFFLGLGLSRLVMLNENPLEYPDSGLVRSLYGFLISIGCPL